MNLTRRQFLGWNAVGLSSVSLAGNLPLLLQRASAAEAKHPNRILVVVELTGGNDGLNTVIPYADPAYHRARPQLGIREGVHRLDDRFGLHPALGPVAELFKEGKAAIVHGVGYPKPNRSHFRSMEIWHTAEPEKTEKYGWLGRFLDRIADKEGKKLGGIALTEHLPQSLRASRANTPAVGELERYGVFIEGEGDVEIKRRLIEKLASPAGETAGKTSSLAFLRRQARNTYTGAQRLREAAGKYRPKGEYEGPLGRQLRMAAQVIAADLGTRVLHVALGGFDTHANQPGTHGELLGQLGRGLSQFLREVKEMGRAGEVLVMTYSEFGRRVRENGSQGTDHGAAAPLFFLGEQVRAGFHGDPPSLTGLAEGDLKYSTDFRSLYATVLEDWLGTKASDVLGAEFSKVALIEGADG
jgi:uncharacterized protein (DUF1501 family)